MNWIGGFANAPPGCAGFSANEYGAEASAVFWELNDVQALTHLEAYLSKISPTVAFTLEMLS
jgi:hypothetical protein